MISSARWPAQASSARAAVSIDSHRSGIAPRAAVNADSRWLSRVLVLASQLSARYQATGTLAEAAKVASSVLLPEPAGATTSPTRCCQIRASSASTRSRARDCACGISTLADTTAPDPSLTLVSPRPLGLVHASFATAPLALPLTRSCLLLGVAAVAQYRNSTRRFAFVKIVVTKSTAGPDAGRRAPPAGFEPAT